MVRDAHSSRKAKGDEASNSNNKRNSYKASSTSGSPSCSTVYGLRRSTRETLSKKQTSSSALGKRKSERLVQQAPTSSPVKKQVERSDNHEMPSPLKKSGKGKNVQPSTPSRSRMSDKSKSSPDLKHQKKKAESSVKQFKNKSSIHSGKKHLRAGVGRTKHLNAGKYRVMFKSLNKVEIPDSQRRLCENSLSGSSSSDGNASRKVQDSQEDDTPIKYVYVRKRKSAENSSRSKDSNESNGEKSLEGNASMEKDGAVKRRRFDGNSPSDVCSRQKSGENSGESKRKINPTQVVSLDSEDVCGKGVCVSSANASSSRSPEPEMNCSVEETTSRSKRQRVGDVNKNEVCSSSVKVSEKQLHDAVARGENENEELRKRMMVGTGIDSSSVKVSAEVEEAVSVKEGCSGYVCNSDFVPIDRTNAHHFGKNDGDIVHSLSKDNTTASAVQVVGSEEKRKALDAQSNLFQLLKPKIPLLCKILQLPEDVRNVAERFLKYVIDNHHVSQESESLQAFQICVCWCAASLLNHDIDHDESFELAKKDLKFSCKEDDVDFLFLKMKLLKKVFSLREFKECKYQNSCSLEVNGHTRERLDGNNIVAAEMVEEGPSVLKSFDQKVFQECNQKDCSLEANDHTRERLDESNVVAAEMVEGGPAVLKSVDKTVFPPIETAEMVRQISRDTKKVLKRSKKRMEKLTKKQLNEFQQFNRNWEEKKTSLVKEHSVQSTVIYSVHSSIPIRMEKLKLLSSEFEKKLQELDHGMAVSRKALEARQQDEKAEEKLKLAHFLEKVRSWGWDCRDEGDLLLALEQSREDEGSNDSTSTSGKSQEDQDLDRVANNDPDHEGTSSEVARISDVICAVDKVINNTLTDTSANIQVEKLPPNSTKTTTGDVSCGAPGPNLTTDESMLCRSVEVVPLVSSSSLNESMGGFNSSQEAVIVESDSDPDHVGVLASDRNSSHLTCQNAGASQSVCKEPTDGQLFQTKSNLVAGAGQGGMLDVVQGHGDEPCEAHGKETHDPTKGEAEKTNSMLPDHDVVLPSSQPSHEVQTNLPAARVAVSEPASTAPFGQAQSVLPISRNRLCQELSLESQNRPNILNLDSSQPSTAFPVHSASGSNWVRSEMDAVARGLGALPECSRSSTSIMVSAIPQLSSDPLHNELERLRKEAVEITRIHEEMVLRLKRERDKVIEQIWRKYETKILEADASYAFHKQRVDTKHKMVLMNKILAETFRSNCNEYEIGPGVRQDLPSSRMQQQVIQSEQPASRPYTLDSAVSNNQPTVGQRNPEVLSRNKGWSELFTSISSRPLQMCPSIPAANNQQMCSDACAPAPHLEYFRPPMSPSSGSLPSADCGPSSRQQVSNPFGSSPLIPELLTRPQQASARPTYLSSSRGWSHQPESVRAPHANQNTRPSARELLAGVGTRDGATQISTLPPLPALTNYWTWDLSEFGTTANVQPSSSDQAATPADVRPSHQGVTEDVVCLSDDD